MINQQLIDYIKQQMQQGMSREVITNNLLSQNWQQQDVNEAFSSLATSPSSQSYIPVNQVPGPMGIKVISVLYFLGSLLAFGFGALAIFGASFFTQILGTGFFGKFFAIGGVIFIALGVLGISIGIGLWRYKNWARLIAVLLSLVGIILTMLSILKGNISSNIFNLIVSGVIGGYLFFSPKVKTAFEPQKGFVPLNKKLLWTSISLLLLVTSLAIAFGSYSTPSSPPTSNQVITPTTNTTVTPTPAETVPVQQVMSPKETYLKMRVEIDGVKNYSDFETIALKYGSQAQVAKIEANREKINALPSSFKDQMVALAKNPSSSEITNVQENINGHTATLNISSSKPGFKGTATFVLENGQWKLELESWKQQ